MAEFQDILQLRGEVFCQLDLETSELKGHDRRNKQAGSDRVQNSGEDAPRQREQAVCEDLELGKSVSTLGT